MPLQPFQIGHTAFAETAECLRADHVLYLKVQVTVHSLDTVRNACRTLNRCAAPGIENAAVHRRRPAATKGIDRQHFQTFFRRLQGRADACASIADHGEVGGDIPCDLVRALDPFRRLDTTEPLGRVRAKIGRHGVLHDAAPLSKRLV
ncbi:hypothetical protein D3C85_1022820 [compost metagenome]